VVEVLYLCARRATNFCKSHYSVITLAYSALAAGEARTYLERNRLSGDPLLQFRHLGHQRSRLFSSRFCLCRIDCGVNRVQKSDGETVGVDSLGPCRFDDKLTPVGNSGGDVVEGKIGYL
jgi:hypothetical protein